MLHQGYYNGFGFAQMNQTIYPRMAQIFADKNDQEGKNSGESAKIACSLPVFLAQSGRLAMNPGFQGYFSS
jgi:hypothetical protein